MEMLTLMQGPVVKEPQVANVHGSGLSLRVVVTILREWDLFQESTVQARRLVHMFIVFTDVSIRCT